MSQVAAVTRRAAPTGLFPLLTVNFIGTLGFSLVLPFLVFLVARWGGNALIYGCVGATYSLFQLLGAPLLGRWSDRFGRKRILLVSQLGTLLAWLIFLIAFALPADPLLRVDSRLFGSFTLTLPLATVFFARALDGLTGGNVSVANAYLADVTGEEDRSAAFGRMSVAANLGFVLGPAVAGLLGTGAAGELLPVMAATLISLVASLIVAFGLVETRCSVITSDPEPTNLRKTFGQEQKECFEMVASEPLGTLQLLRLRGVSLLLLVGFLVVLAFSFFYVSFPVHAMGVLGWSVMGMGIFYSFLGLLMAMVQGPLLGWLSRRVPAGQLASTGSLLLAVGFALLASASSVALAGAVLLIALGNGVMWPSVLSLLSKVAGPEHQGAVQGLAGSSGAVASILGLVLGGALYGKLQGRTFLLSAAIIVVVLLLSLTWLRTRGEELQRHA